MIIEQEECMYIVVYRPHNELNIDTTYYGPFPSWSQADDALSRLPALGIHEPAEPVDNPDCKFIQALTWSEAICGD